MFAQITAREATRSAAQRGLYLLASTVAQGLLAVGIAAAGTWLDAAAPPTEEVVVVQPVVARPSTPRPPAGPRPPPGHRPSGRVAPAPIPLVQPQVVSAAAPAEPGPAEEPAGWDGPEDGAPGPYGPAGPAVDDAPVYATGGFRPPATAASRCVQGAVRVPRDLAGFVSGPITVRFAVGRDAAPGRFTVMTPGVPDRLAAAIWQAVRECRWIAGADAQGRPTALWVVLPLRFEAE